MDLIWKSVLVLLSIFSCNAHADWQCFAVDKGGHYWKSTGMTQERAIAVAMSFCKAYSPNGKTCEPTKCSEMS